MIKLKVRELDYEIKNTPEYDAMRCIGHWLFKALNCIPLYWGRVTRCVNLTQE